MENITLNEIKYARSHGYYPITQAQFIDAVAIQLIKKMPLIEILNYPIATARQDYYEAAQKICDMFNSNNIKKVFGISTFKGLNTLHKKCMSEMAKQNQKNCCLNVPSQNNSLVNNLIKKTFNENIQSHR